MEKANVVRTRTKKLSPHFKKYSVTVCLGCSLKTV